MQNVLVDGEVWQYSFAEAAGFLNQKDREYMLSESIKLYQEGQKSKTIYGENFEGELTTNGKYFSFLSGFGGYKIDADLETEQGRRFASVLVMKLIDSELN